MTTMTMPFTDAIHIAEDHLKSPGIEAARMRTKVIGYLNLSKNDRAKSPVPSLIRRIADAVGCGTTMAARLVQVVDDQQLRAAITFQPNPATLGDLVLWDVVHDFFLDYGRGKSEKSAWTKAIYGQKTKSGAKPGLADTLGEIPALAAFYMLFNGFKGINRVMNITGWSWEHVNNLLAAATQGIHDVLKKIGKTMLKKLKTGFHGISFTVSLMGALGKGKVANKKKIKARKIEKININDDSDDDLDEENEDVVDVGDGGEPGDPQDEDIHHKAPEPGGFDDPESDAQDDDGGDEDDPDEPPKTPRAVAFHILSSTRMRLERMRRRTGEEQRLLDLLGLVDPPTKMVDALQKGTAGPADPWISQRMADCLSLGWQWAQRTGIFAAIPKYQKYLDMPPAQFLAALIAGVRDGYLAPDEVPKPPKPKLVKGEKPESDNDDPGRDWFQVMDWETGRVARVTRKAPPGTAQCPATTAPALDVDSGMVDTFMNHSKRCLKPKEQKKFNSATVKLRFWSTLSGDGEMQVITCERQIHPRKRKGSIEDSVADVENVAGIDDPGNAAADVFDLDAVSIQEDLISFADYQALSIVLKLTPTRIKAGLTGDDEAMEKIHAAIQALSRDERADAQDMVTRMLRLDQADPQAIDDDSRYLLAG